LFAWKIVWDKLACAKGNSTLGWGFWVCDNGPETWTGGINLHAPYTPPEKDASSFNCPHCGAYAHQYWSELKWYEDSTGYDHLNPWYVAFCNKCDKFSVWMDERMMWPPGSTSPLPHPDLPEQIIGVYNEAREIVGQSPRGAAALLRLGLQVLCRELGGNGKNINDDIAGLVKKGLSSGVQKALDIVRVVGNDAVHPGFIDLNDTPEIAHRLFGLINYIVEEMITKPRELEAFYQELPEGKREAIERRDGEG
jgi:hypothetical protein